MKILQSLLVILIAIGIVSCGGNSSSPVGGVKKKIIKVSYSHQADFSSELHMTAWIFQKYVNENSENLEVIITGRHAAPKIIESADQAIEFKAIKHYYRNGVNARVGIDK